MPRWQTGNHTNPIVGDYIILQRKPDSCICLRIYAYQAAGPVEASTQGPDAVVLGGAALEDIAEMPEGDFVIVGLRNGNVYRQCWVSLDRADTFEHSTMVRGGGRVARKGQLLDLKQQFVTMVLEERHPAEE